MGQCSSQSLKKEELEEYQVTGDPAMEAGCHLHGNKKMDAFLSLHDNLKKVLTFLTKGEILRIHEAFCNSCPHGKDYKQEKLTVEKVCTWPQLKVNPFRDRICKLFATDGFFTFDDILGMASVFSDLACPLLKIEYVFRIYDFNEDGFIDEEDLQKVIRRLLSSKNLQEEVIMSMADRVLKDADLDNDKMLSLTEFEHAMTQRPDFLYSFRIYF